MEEAAAGMSLSERKLFHYTSHGGLNSILKNGFIRGTLRTREKNHAHFGEGTYGTSLPPGKGRDVIAKNNWTSHWRSYVNRGKVDIAIEVSIPEHEVSKVGPPNRDILLYPGGNLHLYKYSGKVWTVPKNYMSSPVLLQTIEPNSHVPGAWY